ncbi:MAG: DedA family protein [Verrucomicrobia bacterium]|nr:DedA family protein [Verrucomicrobiota bacterium]
MADSSRLPLIVSASISIAILALAGVLGARGVIAGNAVVGLALVAAGGFLLFALRDRIRRLRMGKVVVELKGIKSPLEEPATHTNPIRKMYAWTLHWSGTPYALPALVIISFLESSIFPIPPDVLLIPMVLARPSRAWTYAVACTGASVVGGWAGYAIGHYLYNSVGAPVIAFYHLQSQFETFRNIFNTYGAWIVLIKGMTPVPYKLITITAGATGMNWVTFSIASIISRFMRFFLEAELLRRFGPAIRPKIDRYLEAILGVLLLLLIGGFFLLKFLR